MPVRDTMTDLIAELRRLVADTETPTIFSDTDLQTSLDRYRTYVAAMELEPVDERSITGVRAPTLFVSPEGFWEANAYLQGQTWQLLDASSTPSVTEANVLIGQWRLSDPYIYNVYVSGTRYDIYAAAVELLEEMYAQHMLDFDFLSAGRTFKRSQSLDNIERLIKRYRLRQGPTLTDMIRTDVAVF